MVVKFGYNPFEIKSEFYNDFEKRRKKAGKKKPKQQVEDEERYDGSVKKFRIYNKIWQEEQAKRKEKEENGHSRKEYWKERYKNKQEVKK